MLLRIMLKVAALTCVLSCAGALPAKAELWVDVDCYCDPATERNSVQLENGATVSGCICTQSHTLGKLASMEFRFRCKKAPSGQEPVFWYPIISNLDKPSTCTGLIYTEYTNYLSQSCTNWSTLSTDTIKLQVLCP